MTEIVTNLECQKKIIARKILAEEKLSVKERMKAAEWITGGPVPLPKKKRGRKSGASDDTTTVAALFNVIRPDYRTDTEAYKHILQVLGKCNDVDSIRKAVKAGQDAMTKPEIDEIAKSLRRRFESEVLKDL